MDPEKIAKSIKDDDQNVDYIGNMWGWKFSFFSLFLIVCMAGVTYYGHVTGKLDIRTGEPMKKPTTDEVPASKDTISIQ